MNLAPTVGALAAMMLIVANGCSPTRPGDPAPGGRAPSGTSSTAGRPDVHSYARPDEIRVTHLDLNWRVDFDRHVLEGDAVLGLERGAQGAGKPLHLDTRDLAIAGVSAWKQGGEVRETTWHLAVRDPILGAELVVDLPADADRVRIRYATSPEASALQWLEKEQTAGGKHPFLYTQAQAIHARSFVPCQDSPGVRITYNATVRVRGPLRAVMAARDLASPAGAFPGTGPARFGNGENSFRYEMTHPIPPYLIALAVGDLVFGPIGPRTGVWTEPVMLDRAVREFADMEKMLVAAEGLYGPYRWERYDLLILPPSFPFGGMENPMLTFASPTVVAGDRSLVALVAHEMAHSWSGNLVTNATWSDFWLNEGFTTYIERRIMEAVYGRERAVIEWMLGEQDLERELGEMKDKPGDQKLRIDLAGRDPDDGVTAVPYDKGALFVLRLEEAYGRAAFDPFLRSWFDTHAFTSVTTDTFASFLEERLLRGTTPLSGQTAPDVALWIDGPGLPPDVPRLHSDALERVALAMRQFASGAVAARGIDATGWTTQHWVRFLRAVPADLPASRLSDLDAAFALTRAGNSDILTEWLLVAIHHDYAPAYPRLASFLTEVGRRKYVRPLYNELVKSAAGKQRAREIYAVAGPHYHAITRRMVEDMLK